MKTKRILIAEDDSLISGMLYKFLNNDSCSVETAADGQQAFEKYTAAPADIVITDIEMPVMNGDVLIDKLQSLEYPPIIFVITSHCNPSVIIDIMKKGIYDYIIKPVDLTDLSLKITRAFETASMKKTIEIAQKEKVIRLENNLKWYALQEKMNTKGTKVAGNDIFQSLISTLNQGAGFGTLVSLMGIIRDASEKEGDDYRIDGELFDVALRNVAFAEKALETFAEISRMTSSKTAGKNIPVSVLYHDALARIKNLSGIVELQKHRIIVSDYKEIFSDFFIFIECEHFLAALEEIITNALKFSPPESDIILIFHTQGNTFSLSVINDVHVNGSGQRGIPMGYENLVFEPFYRLDKTVHEMYNTLDYGLGLTLVDRIVVKYAGKASINNINDYSDIKNGVKTKVECSLIFKKSV